LVINDQKLPNWVWPTLYIACKEEWEKIEAKGEKNRKKKYFSFLLSPSFLSAKAPLLNTVFSSANKTWNQKSETYPTGGKSYAVTSLDGGIFSDLPDLNTTLR
jgi:hypothetical protein